MTDLAYLNKQEIMRLFTIRDRTFYSWIEKGILNPADDVDGQKRYDISKALKLKNIHSSDVTSLLATQANVLPEEDDEVQYVAEKPNASQEVVSNLKSQLDTLKAELSEERDRSKALISRMGIFENQQKLIGEVRANETQLMELAQKRENKLMDVFQERMKEIIIISQENENVHYDKILESVKEVQTERERSLKGLIKMSLIFFAIIFFFSIVVFWSVYHFQDKQISSLVNSSTDKETKMRDEIKANADRIITMQKIHEQEMKTLDENLQKRIEGEKQTLTSFYTQSIKILQSQMDLVSKEKNGIKDDKDELRVQIQILELKFKSVLDELLSEKKSNTVAVKEQEGLRKSLMDINESINKLREKSSTPTPVIEVKEQP
jgi:hypothetical protein